MSDEQRRRNNNNRHRGSAFEKRVADYLGMEVVPYSGSNSRFGFGDIKHPLWLGECKNITLRVKERGNTIHIDNEWIIDITRRASDVGKLPFLAFVGAGRTEKFILIPAASIDRFSHLFVDQIYGAVNKMASVKAVHWTLNHDALVKLVKIGRYVIIDKVDPTGNKISATERVALVRIETFKDVIMPYVERTSCSDRSQ